MNYEDSELLNELCFGDGSFVERSIKIMKHFGDYPKKRVNDAIMQNSGKHLEDEVFNILADWVLNIKIPKVKNAYYKENDTGEWQSWK